MTDNEIIKAAECCKARFCCDCPRLYCTPNNEDDCRLNLISDTLVFIERLRNERDYWISQYTIKCTPLSATAIMEETCRESMRVEYIQKLNDQIEMLKSELSEARRDCTVAESNHQAAINDFKTALLKKIFPYDAVDKKQYSINAYAVEKAIIEVAELLGGVNENN